MQDGGSGCYFKTAIRSHQSDNQLNIEPMLSLLSVRRFRKVSPQKLQMDQMCNFQRREAMLVARSGEVNAAYETSKVLGRGSFGALLTS